jgi:hypothetical protein
MAAIAAEDSVMCGDTEGIDLLAEDGERCDLV